MFSAPPVCDPDLCLLFWTFAEGTVGAVTVRRGFDYPVTLGRLDPEPSEIVTGIDSLFSVYGSSCGHCSPECSFHLNIFREPGLRFELSSPGFA